MLSGAVAPRATLDHVKGLLRSSTAAIVTLLLSACTQTAPEPPSPTDELAGRLLVLETAPCNWLPPPDRCDALGLAILDLNGEKLEDLTPEAPASMSFNSVAVPTTRDRVAWSWNWEIYTMSLDGSEPRVMNEPPLQDTVLELSYDPTWSPDGTELLYRSVGTSMVSAWYRLDVETGESTQVRMPVDCWGMAWAPAGDMVACEVRQRFVRGQDDEERADIYIVDLATLESAPLTLAEDAIDDRRPDWSPDGEWLAVARGSRDPELAEDVSGIWLLPADGGEGTRVAPGNLSAPSWSPDGSHLAAFDGDSMRIVTFARDGSGFTTLDHEPRRFVAPHWIGD